jgi:hypothetical protein
VFVLQAIRTTHYTRTHMDFQQFIDQIVNNSNCEYETACLRTVWPDKHR